MSRRAKIVCTLGPATSSPEQITALVEAGMDVARLNFSHGAHAHHATAYRAGPGGLRQHRPRRSPSWPTCRARRSGSARSPTARSSGRPAARSCITVEDVAGTAERVSTTYKDLANDVRRRRPAARRRRQARARPSSGVDGPRRLLPGRRGRPGVEQQGPLAARRRGQRARAVGQGRGGPALRAAAWAWTSSRCPSSARPTTSSWSATSCAEEDIDVPVIAKLEKPEAVEQPRGDRRGVRRRSWSPAATSAWSCRWSRCRWCRSAPIQAARERNKPVIVATQMLESMIDELPARPAPRPPTSPTPSSTAPTR